MTFAITPLYASLLGILYMFLSFRIPRLRMKHQVGLGDGGVPVLQRAIRAHANFAEYVPFALLLLMLLESTHGYSPWFIYFLGCVLLIARLMHAHGLNQSAGHSPGRFLGTVLTFFVIFSCSALLLLNFALSW